MTCPKCGAKLVTPFVNELTYWMADSDVIYFCLKCGYKE